LLDWKILLSAAGRSSPPCLAPTAPLVVPFLPCAPTESPGPLGGSRLLSFLRCSVLRGEPLREAPMTSSRRFPPPWQVEHRVLTRLRPQGHRFSADVDTTGCLTRFAPLVVRSNAMWDSAAFGFPVPISAKIQDPGGERNTSQAQCNWCRPSPPLLHIGIWEPASFGSEPSACGVASRAFRSGRSRV
jgi:hypothetical protein